MNRNILIISSIAIIFVVVLLIVLLTRHHKNKDVSGVIQTGNLTNVIYLDENGTYNLNLSQSGSTIVVFTSGLTQQYQRVINLPDITNNVNGVHFKIMVFDDPQNSGVNNAILRAYPNSQTPISITSIPSSPQLTKNVGDQASISLNEINLRSFNVVSYNGFWYVSI